MDYEFAQGRPADAASRAPEELACYDLLDRLGIEYRRVDHPAAETMAALEDAERALDTPVCKNLVLCNRQQTQFYLLLMPGDKPFRTKDLSQQLGVARLSFAPPEAMERLLGVQPGSASVLGLQFDREGEVRLLIDREVLAAPRFGCHPCRNTSSLAFSASDFREKLLPALGHEPTLVDLPRAEAE